MTTLSSPIVFIVDDDEDMRLAMQRILKTVNLRAELFATAQDSAKEYSRCSELPGVGCAPSWNGRIRGPTEAD